MMYSALDIPVWVAVCVAFLLIAGALLALIGSIGFLRLPTFYERIHAPTLGTSWGIGGVMLGSMVYFSAAASRLAIHEILIGVFVTLTTPITLMMLARAALHRDRVERNGKAPPKQTPEPDSNS
ncbi:monovalent cation/H(+) antiporter subunit G [Rhizobium sp. AN80A]|uniref:monovalent cation/H(+) antiporter subunit G n=1 Tax=Rhizobium sp. AN80A TaxID=3040673 RepID=UPI0024B39616|nr:monovalent cation/H(+) antiporter subunit G [Rhizobium sp. AN80A]